MANTKLRIGLNNAIIPLISTKQPSAAFVPGLDTINRSPKQFYGSDSSADYNIPQIIYAENITPWGAGVKSVRYAKVVNAVAGVSTFDQVIPLRDEDENTRMYSPAGGKDFLLDSSGVWQSSPLRTRLLAEVSPKYLVQTDAEIKARRVSRASVGGFSFVCYPQCTVADSEGGAVSADASIYYWNSTALVRQNPQAAASETNLITGVDSELRGQITNIGSSSGYLLMSAGLELLWAAFDGASFNFDSGSAIQATDAGRQTPEDVRGKITALVPVSGGFIIFTAKNAVGASYTSSSPRSPWIFREIANAGGVDSYEQVSVESGQAFVYAYTTGGLQRVSLNSAESFAPEVTDFLGGRLQEIYNTETRELELTTLSSTYFVKLTYVGARTVVISYGTFPTIYTHALVYDTVLQRWGKLKVRHTDAFTSIAGDKIVGLTYADVADLTYEELAEVQYGETTVNFGDAIYPRQALSFITNSGKVVQAVFDFGSTEPLGDEEPSTALMIVGDVQASRGRESVLTKVVLRGVDPSVVVSDIAEQREDLTSVALDLIETQVSSRAAVHEGEINGQRHRIVLEGHMDLTDLEVEFWAGGKV